MKPGDKITYTPTGEKGIVKSVTGTGHLFIVFSCGEYWENYQNYTAALYDKRDVVIGWKTKSNME